VLKSGILGFQIDFPASIFGVGYSAYASSFRFNESPGEYSGKPTRLVPHLRKRAPALVFANFSLPFHHEHEQE